MQRILSTYRFVNQPLGPGLIAEIAQAGFSAIEIFCSQQHFDYREPQAVREMADAVGEYRLSAAFAACAHRARYFAGARKRSADFNFRSGAHTAPRCRG